MLMSAYHRRQSLWKQILDMQHGCDACGAFHCRQSLWNQILERWGPPVEPLPDPRALQDIKSAGQAANTASMVHKLDLFCRKELSIAMQQLSTDKVNAIL